MSFSPTIMRLRDWMHVSLIALLCTAVCVLQRVLQSVLQCCWLVFAPTIVRSWACMHMTLWLGCMWPSGIGCMWASPLLAIFSDWTIHFSIWFMWTNDMWSQHVIGIKHDMIWFMWANSMIRLMLTNDLLSCAWGEVGGWGRDPKKCTGRGWGMGSSTI